MYLIPRLIGISTYIILVLMTCGLISKFQEKEIPKLLFICDIILFIMAYCYAVTPTDDLSRLLPIMHKFANMNFNQLIQEMTNNSNYPVLVLFYHIVGIFHNDRLLPAITSIISYSFFFLIISKCSRLFNNKNIDIAMAFYLFMARGIFVIGITNIRTLIVVSVLCYLIYQEILEDKSFFFHLPVYIALCLFHAMGIVILIIRFIFLLFNKKELKHHPFQYVITIIIVFLIAFKYGIDYIQNFTQKTDIYIKSSLDGSGYDYIYERIISILCVIIFAFLIFHSKKILHINKDKTFAPFLKFCNFILYVEIFMFFVEYASFFRINWILSIFIVPLYLYVASNTSKEKMKTIKSYLVILGTLMFTIEFTRGYLCSLKYFLSFSELLS